MVMIVSQYGNQLYSKEKKKKKKTLCSVDMIMPPKGHNQIFSMKEYLYIL